MLRYPNAIGFVLLGFFSGTHCYGQEFHVGGSGSTQQMVLKSEVYDEVDKTFQRFNSVGIMGEFQYNHFIAGLQASMDFRSMKWNEITTLSYYYSHGINPGQNTTSSSYETISYEGKLITFSPSARFGFIINPKSPVSFETGAFLGYSFKVDHQVKKDSLIYSEYYTYENPQLNQYNHTENYTYSSALNDKLRINGNGFFYAPYLGMTIHLLENRMQLAFKYALVVHDVNMFRYRNTYSNTDRQLSFSLSYVLKSKKNNVEL